MKPINGVNGFSWKWIGVVKPDIRLLLLLPLLAGQLPAQPVITNQPSSRVVWASGNATFAVGVFGDGPFSYQWQLNSNGLPDGIITTVAGNGTPAYSGDGGAAIYAGVTPTGVALDASGNLFIADSHNSRIRKVNTNGIITTVAGNGTATYSGDGGAATNAGLNYPPDMAVDASGNLFIVDKDNQRIREVDTNGIITTVAGNGTNGFSGDGGAATNASLSYPLGVAVDASGNLFIADYRNERIREVSTNGIITTVAGNGVNGSSGDGGAATNASLNFPYGMAVDAAGNLFIADTGNSRIREVGTDGIITLVAGGGNGSDINAATNASLLFPSGVALDASGNLFIADTFRWLVRKASSNGIITTVAGNGKSGYTGDGGAATNASLNTPTGVAVDASGNLFIADANNNCIRKVILTQGPILVLNNVIATNAGNYQVVVTDAGGSVTSSVANLTVYTIISQPASRTNVQGTTATFTVDVGGITPASYQWFKNGLMLTNGGNVTGSIASTLSLSNVQDADAASYAVVVSNNLAGSVTSPSAFLTVIDWPVVTNQPASQAVWAGGNVAFGVGVSGPGPFTYQWQLNSNDLPSGIITTVAGNGTPAYSGDGGAATNASLYWPSSVAVDACGNLFVVDVGNNRLREVNTKGIITTVAGIGPSGHSGSYSGDGGLATNANLNLNSGNTSYVPQPSGLAVDASGNVFIADTYNSRIREVTTNGIIKAVAGNGTITYSGDGVAATNAGVVAPTGVALDTSGNLFIADAANQRIRKVDTNAIITTVAGKGGYPQYSGDGGVATNASLNTPNGVAVDASGNLFIADSNNGRLRKVGTNGIITTVAGKIASSYSGDGGAATNASMNDPSGVAVDASGVLFIADTWNNRIRKVDSDGIITTIAGGGVNCPGDGGMATNAVLAFPTGAAVDAFGNLFIADQQASRIRKVTNTQWPAFALNNVSAADAGIYQVVVAGPAGSITSSIATLTVGTFTSQPASRANLAGSTATFSVAVEGITSLTYQWLKNGIIMTDGGNVSGSTAATLALTNVQDADAAFYMVVVSNNLAGSATSSPALLSVIDITAQPASQAVWPGGNVSFTMGVSGTGPLTYQWQLNGTNLPNAIITTVAGNGSPTYSGDGGTATNASLNNPQTVALDALGNLFIADTGNNRIREISTNGIITTVAGGGVNYPGDGGPATNASLASPAGVVVDAAGNLFITDSQNARLCKVNTNGIITTLAGTNGAGFSGDGGPATNAKLSNPQAVAVDASGNLFIADYGNNRVRGIDTNGIITTLAGTNSAGFSGDGGAATSAKLSNPQAVAVDTSGNLFIADSGNNRIRELGTNGIITTLAGTNAPGFSGDGGPATNAKLSHPVGVAVDTSGNLFIADYANNRIREIGTNGIITTLVGTNSLGFSGDGGPATNAKLSHPFGVAVDTSGNLLIADTSNRRIRRVTNTQGPSLTLNNVSVANAGNYQLAVTGHGGSVTSSVAVLAVVLPPTSFTAQLGGAGLQLQLAGTPNYPYVLQMATNLTPPVNWQPILTNPADANGYWNFTLTNLSGIPAGFYRAVGR